MLGAMSGIHSPRKASNRQRSQPASPRSPAKRPAAMAIGLGDPVTDMVVNVSADELSAFEGEPGGCSTIDSASLASMLQALDAMGKSAQRLPGGSAANVMRCLANLAEDTRVLCEPFKPLPLPRIRALRRACRVIRCCSPLTYGHAGHVCALGTSHRGCTRAASVARQARTKQPSATKPSCSRRASSRTLCTRPLPPRTSRRPCRSA